MVPKDKAKELVQSFQNLKPPKLSDYSQIHLPTAKLCARRVAEEMLEEVKEHKYDDTSAIRIIYWMKVIKEIEKL